MKSKFFGLLILFSLLGSLSSAGSVLAQSPLPPRSVPTPFQGIQAAPWTPEGGPRLSSESGAPGTDLGTQSVPLGPSGLSFRYLQTFGNTTVGYLADQGHLNYPWGIGTSGNSIWMGELWGNRALRYTGVGGYVQQIGIAGFPYLNGTSIHEIADVAADSAGNIWVVDDSAAHIAEFDSSGNFLKNLGVTYAQGTDNGHFASPVSIAFDGSGNIYVSDGAPWSDSSLGNQRIQIFDSTGAYLATIGETGVVGTANDHFHGPRHIAVYGTQLYVADAGNHRVQIFDITTPSAPTYVATLGTTGVSGTGAAQFNNPSGVAVDADYIYVADTGNNRVRVFDHAGNSIATILGGTRGTANTQFDNPTDVAVDALGKLYVADFVNTRVQQFTHIGAAFTYARTYGATGVPYLTDNNHYNAPSGVALASDGSIFLTEDMGQRLLKLNASGVPLWTVGSPGVKGDWSTSNIRFDNPADVAVDSSSHVYVADRQHARVQIYNSFNGAYLASISGLGCPGGVHIDNPHGLLDVADSCDSTVKIYTTTTRTLVATLGASGVAGSDNAHFNWPQDVAVDGLGTIYVADQNNNRVQVFNSGRAYVRSIGTGVCGEAFDQLCSPGSLAVDGGNRLYVSDGGNNRVQVFDSSGAYLTTIAGSWGSASGQLRSPAGVAVDTVGNLYVADWGNDRIQKFAPGTPGWSQMNLNGFGDRGVVGAEVLAPFGGQLYAAAYSDVAQVLRTTNGTTWSSMVTDGFGDSHNVRIPDLAEFNGKLYAGTWNCASIDCTTSNGAQIWRTDGSAWSSVMTGGFGSANNFAVNTLTVFSGQLYAATSSSDGVIKIYRSPTGDSGSWVPVMTDGFGGSGVLADQTTAVYGGYLYVGLDRNGLGELWRCQLCDGSDWSSVFTNGLGNAHNDAVRSIAEFNGVLYVGLRNSTTGGEVWKSTNGTTFTRAFAGGLGKAANARPDGLYSSGGSLYVVFSNTMTGSEVWRTTDGIKWTSIAAAGWGDSNNVYSDYMNKGAAAFGSGGGQLFIGVDNLANGAEIWSAILQQVKSYPSAGAYDGWILESGENTNIGGTSNIPATTFNLGDDIANKQYRAILSFNTSAVPDTALIKSAVLKIRQSGPPVHTNPFIVLGSLLVDVRKPSFGTSPVLQLTDFNAASSAARVGTFNETPSSGWYSVTLNAAGLTGINKAGTTQFRLYFSLDDNNNHLANVLHFFSGNAPTASRPQLVITYQP